MGLAVWAPDLRRESAARKVSQHRRVGVGYDDQHAAIQPARAPEPEVVVYPDDRREINVSPEMSKGSCFAEGGGQDADSAGTKPFPAIYRRWTTVGRPLASVRDRARPRTQQASRGKCEIDLSCP